MRIVAMIVPCRRTDKTNQEIGGQIRNALCDSRNASLEARGGIEPPMRVLQTLALPLGHRARLIAYSILLSGAPRMLELSSEPRQGRTPRLIRANYMSKDDFQC